MGRRSTFLEVPRHPDFDLYWHGDGAAGIPAHKDYVYKLARLAAKRYRGDYRDYLGTVVILFNKALHGLDPAKGQLTTFLGNFAVRHVGHYFAKRDSQAAEVAFRHHNNGYARQAVASISERREGDDYLPVPCHDRRYDGPEWDQMMKCLTTQQKLAVEAYYRDGATLEEIARRSGVTRSRVGQVLFKARARIREKFPEMQVA